MHAYIYIYTLVYIATRKIGVGILYNIRVDWFCRIIFYTIDHLPLFVFLLFFLLFFLRFDIFHHYNNVVVSLNSCNFNNVVENIIRETELLVVQTP